MTNFIDGERIAKIIQTELPQLAVEVRVRSFRLYGDPKLHITTPKDDKTCRISAWVKPQEPPIIKIDELYPREPLNGVGTLWARAIEKVGVELLIPSIEVEVTPRSKPFWEKMGFIPGTAPDLFVKQVIK